ncbi:MAG: transketolase [Lachnospiraceae bacterium]|nr:transketolase [Lachnospiraceae bacterium]
MTNLEEKAEYLRREVLKICYETQSGHPTSALSCVEIMTSLVYGGIMNFKKENMNAPDRDRFILSKGHACILQYIIWADLGMIEERELHSFCKKGSALGGHANRLIVPGIEFSPGSLGHGLSYAMGQALNAKYCGSGQEVYVLMGDGECQEGSVWEAALCASSHRLDNLTVIIDANKLQSSGFVKDISNIDPLNKKWEAFGYQVIEADGHDIVDLQRAFETPHETGRPRAVIAHTLKGKGVSLMENQNYWHAKRPNKEQWEVIKRELNIAE